MVDIEDRLRAIEQQIAEIQKQLAVLATGIALARWLGPFAVSVAAMIIILAKGG